MDKPSNEVAKKSLQIICSFVGLLAKRLFFDVNSILGCEYKMHMARMNDSAWLLRADEVKT